MLDVDDVDRAYVRVSYCEKTKRTVSYCSRRPGQTAAVLYIIFCVGFATGSVVFALMPTPPFLLDLQPGTHRGLTLTAWAVVSLVSSVLSGMVIDWIGHKRVLSFGLVLAHFSLLVMGSAIALHPHPASSPVFWISSVMASSTLAAVQVAAVTAAATFSKHPISVKFVTALVSLCGGLGLGLASLLNAPFVKREIAGVIATDAPGIAHVETAIAVFVAAAGTGLGLFAVSFVKKNRHMEEYRFGGPFKSLKQLSTWRFVAFTILLGGAKSAVAYFFYAVPHYASEVVGIEQASPGLSVLVVSVGTALLGLPIQVLFTNANPFAVMGSGAVLASLGMAAFMLAAPWIIGPVGLAIAAGLVVLGEAIWWPRMLSYAFLASGHSNAGVFFGLSETSRWYGFVVAALLSPVLLDTYCSAPASCDTLPLWLIITACAVGPSILCFALVRMIGDPEVRSQWSKILKVDIGGSVDENEMEPVNLESSSEDNDIALDPYEDSFDGNPF